MIDDSPTPSLQVFEDEQLIFESFGKWLYPLLDLEKYLKVYTGSRDNLLIRDKIVGKAAAFLICALQPRRVHALILSELALPVFEANNLPVTYDQLVARIDCQTETLMREMSDIAEARRLIYQRAGILPD